MARPSLVLKVPADYVGYMAMKLTLQAIIRMHAEEGWAFTGEEAAELAEGALRYVADTERDEG